MSLVRHESPSETTRDTSCTGGFKSTTSGVGVLETYTVIKTLSQRIFPLIPLSPSNLLGEWVTLATGVLYLQHRVCVPPYRCTPGTLFRRKTFGSSLAEPLLVDTDVEPKSERRGSDVPKQSRRDRLLASEQPPKPLRHVKSKWQNDVALAGRHLLRGGRVCHKYLWLPFQSCPSSQDPFTTFTIKCV